MKLVEDLKEGDILYAYNVEEDVSDYKLEIYHVVGIKRYSSYNKITYIPIIGDSGIVVDFPRNLDLDIPFLVSFDYNIHTIYTTNFDSIEPLVKEDENFPYLQSRLSFYFDNFYDIWTHKISNINELRVK